ncbi:IMP cyclohydrolase [uncultured Mailhella sp.]|mgnify:FL=1|uniref:IMP cyclohydrolase n=1 Tax=uncultured Mailhella sp. TaxID=1981031 RepID=UPI0025DA8F7E|nr:IMP cyclohydrolase [uncultured Mailhella sp.]
MSELKDMYRTIVADGFPDTMTITLGDSVLTYHKRTWEMGGEVRGLRYGENPDQPAALYEFVEGENKVAHLKWRSPKQGIVSALTEKQMVQSGKHPGKTNLTDVDNACNILQYLSRKPAAAILKHNNPCGAAWADTLFDALNNAFWCDRIAAFGGAVVVNRPLDMKCAELIASQYFEVVAAPAFEEGVVDVLKGRKNLRIFELPGLAHLDELKGIPMLDFKSLTDGGIIMQKSFVNRINSVEDFIPATGAKKDGTVFTARKPTEKEAEDLLFAWAVEAGVTSNSVIFVRDGATVAIGTGEQDRVGCAELAIHKAYTKHADVLCFKRTGLSLYELQQKALSDAESAALLDEINRQTREEKGGLIGSVVVSDGFFPFRDGVDVVMAQGVTAIAHPGGSIRDWEVVQACNEHEPQVAMVYTGQRSFKH